MQLFLTDKIQAKESKTINMIRSTCKADVYNGLDKQTGVYIVENNKIIRANLRTTINEISLNSTLNSNIKSNIKITGESSYYDNYLDDIFKTKPNVVILSSFNSIKDRSERIKQIQKDTPLVKPIVLTDTPDEEEFCTSVISGAKGYCRQDAQADELSRAIRIVANGDSYYDETMGNFIFRIIKHMGHLKQLPIDKPIEEQIPMSQRELQVLKAAALTKTYKEAGEMLCISPNTVKMHLSKIYRKLGVETKLEAILKMQAKIYEFKF